MASDSVAISVMLVHKNISFLGEGRSLRLELVDEMRSKKNLVELLSQDFYYLFYPPVFGGIWLSVSVW